MSMKREAYEALVGVVGPENISQDSAIIYSYLLQFTHGLSSTKFIPAEIEAVVLPGSTEEVQAIMRICSRYKIRFKAHSTGWGVQGIPLRKGSILLDLRRMDRIIKIDEKNMFAVIEPYVTARELQAEAMKKGLTCHVIGAGSQHSVLASATSWVGMGVTANTMSYNNRNMLGFELVTPTGEIVKTGAVEEGKFGDPGPSVRGVIRGFCGAMGALGVFTKCAVKLYPWPGPAVLEVTGVNPKYGWRIPKNMELHLLSFPSWEKLSEACYRLNEEQLAYIIWSYSPTNLLLGVSVSNNNYYDIWEMVFKDELLGNRYPLQILVSADSEREFEYKEKVLKEILEETGAKDFMPAIVNVQLMELMCVTLITQYVNSLIFRPSFGEFLTSYGQYVTWDDDMRAAKSCNEVRSKYVEEGKFVDDGFENMWGGPEEQYTYGHFEGLFCPDPADVASMKARDEYVGETHEEILRQKLMGTLTIPLGGSPQILAPKDLGQKLSNYMRWSKAIKESLDPDNLAEGPAYLEKDDIQKYFETL